MAVALLCTIVALSSTSALSSEKPDTSPRRLGEGYNKQFQPSSPERVVVSSEYMGIRTPERKNNKIQKRKDTAEYYVSPKKSVPLVDDGPSIILKETKSKVSYNPEFVDQDIDSNSLDGSDRPTEISGDFSPAKFTTVFTHLFEIIQDILNIMRQMYYPDPTEKSGTSATWPMLKSVFLRYLRLVKETDILIELRKLIPIEELESAVQEEDGHRIIQAVMKSLNPSMFSFIFSMLKELIMPFAHFTDNLAVSELREYIPATPSLDITWPIKFIVRKGLGIIGQVFSRRELGNMWQEFRSYSPFTARSLEYVFPLEEEEPTSNSISIEPVVDASVGRLLTNPYVLLAGFGSSILASVVAYSIMGNEEEIGSSRNKRSAEEPFSPIMPGNANIVNLLKILKSVDPTSGEIDRLTQDITEAKPKKSYNKKFDPLHKLVNFANK